MRSAHRFFLELFFFSTVLGACAETPAPVKDRAEPSLSGSSVAASPPSASAPSGAAPSASVAAAPLPENPCAGKDLDLGVLPANKACKVDAAITRRFEPSELVLALRTLSPPGKGGEVVDFEVTLENKTAAPLAMTFRCAKESADNSMWGDGAIGGFGGLGGLESIGKPARKKPTKKEKPKANKPRVARTFAIPPEPPGSAPGFLVMAEDQTGRVVTGVGLLGLLAPPPCKIEIAQGGRAHALVRWKAMGIPKSEEATAYEPLAAGTYKVRIDPPWAGATDAQGNTPSASGILTITQ